MITQKLRELLEDFHRKKWFIEKYPDPYGEFIDSVTDEMIRSLVSAFEKDKRGSNLDVAYYIFRLLPEIQFRDHHRDYQNAFAKPFHENVLPEFGLYWVRNAEEERSLILWNEFEKWNQKWSHVLHEKARSVLATEKKHEAFLQIYGEQLRVLQSDESELRGTRDFFEWELNAKTKARSYYQLLRYFDLQRWKSSAPWIALPRLAKSIEETCGLPHSVPFQQSINDAIQNLFPVAPPQRVSLEYGRATGPYDALRFLVELGKGHFYAGMNAQNQAEERLCGDPALPWFWGYLFASLIIEPEGVRTFIGPNAESLAEDTQLILQFWSRQEQMLSLYRNRVGSDLSNAQDHFAALWELAFPLEPPLFLSLYDLCRSDESLYRFHALRSSQKLIKHLRDRHGYRWFANRKWTQRMREYWWEGFRLSTKDVLADQQTDQ